jgi:hypothetical protein
LGFLEADSVAHCGSSLAGSFIWSLTYTDLHAVTNPGISIPGSPIMLPALGPSGNAPQCGWVARGPRNVLPHPRMGHYQESHDSLHFLRIGSHCRIPFLPNSTEARNPFGLSATLGSPQSASDKQRQSILAQNGLTTVPGIKVGTETEVIASLEAISLEMWEANRDALPQRFQNAQREAAKLLEPKVVYVTLPSATIHNDTELQTWLAQVRKQVQEKLKDGPVGIG